MAQSRPGLVEVLEDEAVAGAAVARRTAQTVSARPPVRWTMGTVP